MSRLSIQIRLAGIVIVAAAGVFLSGSAVQFRRNKIDHAPNVMGTGQPQLVSVEPISSNANGEMCEWQPASTQELLRASLQSQGALGRI